MADFLRTIGTKLRSANEALATAQKSWRDEQLSNREAALSAREQMVARQLAEIRERSRANWWRRLKYGAATAIIGVVAFVAGITTGANGGSDKTETEPQAPKAAPIAAPPVASPAIAPSGVGERLVVSSDPRARYQLLSWRLLPNGNREAMTRRNGPSGESYSRREIDCSANTSRYLATGDTLAEAQLDRPDPNMGPLIAGSISSEIAGAVCAR